ncbi:hypothetical protein [Azomonas agilis]|uniref:hypothetical protein n=1 Tax=Azomonas agilis TaxID=116849 RepID=UPI001B8652DC|nr:hypothetical protein [Azomonas agilis]
MPTPLSPCYHQFGDQNQLIHFLRNLAMAGGLLQVALYADPQTRSKTSGYTHA